MNTRLTRGQLKKLRRGLCISRRCNNPGVYKKGGLCHKHYRRKDMERNPLSYLFQRLKYHAKERGVPFSFTIESFQEWLKSNPEYLSKRGRTKRKLHIDRIDREDPRGYHPENVQLLTCTENVRKWHELEKACPF